MKTIKDFKVNEISDQNVLTINGGDCGTQTEKLVVVCDPPIMETTHDWKDEGCCEQ